MLRRVGVIVAWALLAASLGGGPFAAAQGPDDAACPAFVDEALALVDAACDRLGANEACYGHTLVEATFQADAPVTFAAPADRAALDTLHTISTAPLNLDAATWGLAVLNLQARVAEALPGQAVTFLLMGDAQLENAAGADDGAVAPLQAFYFSTGLGEPQCAAAPDALVVQAPRGVDVTLRINDLDVTIGSTVVLTTTDAPDGSGGRVLVAQLVEGTLRAPGLGVTLRRPGDVLAVSLNARGRVDRAARLVDLTGEDRLAARLSQACQVIGQIGRFRPIATRLCTTRLRFVTAADDPPVTSAAPTTAPQPVETTHVWPYWNVNTGHRCEVISGSTRIIFGAGSGCYASAAEAEAAGSQVHVTVTIDGAQTVPIDGVTGVRAQPETSGCGPAFAGAQAWDVGWQSAPVTLTAGAHTFYFEETSSFRPTLSLTCAYTAR